MAHDGDARVVLDVADEAVAAARDDEVDVLVEREQRGDLRARLDRLDVAGRDRRLGERVLDRLREQPRRLV